jgi:hypothetical protein
VASNSPEILDYLLANNFPVNADYLCSTAARRSRHVHVTAMLQVLHEHGLLTDAERLTNMLNIFCVQPNLPAAKFLRDTGAEWPSVLRYKWDGKVLAWARAEGCTAQIG